MSRRRRIPLLLVVLVAGLALLALLLILRPLHVPPPAGVVFRAAGFEDLPGWREDAHEAALAAFRRSCERRLRLPDARPVAPEPLAGRVADWRAACTRALEMGTADGAAARRFFEETFRPLAVLADGEVEGLFTGYYEPLIEASRTPDARFRVPLYRRPPELVTVDLGEFREDLRGRRIAGAVEGGRLRPYASRAEIAAGALAGRGLELLWTDDPVALFFLQIQGSGRARLPDGTILGLGYDGPNGHPYTSLGRLMVDRRALHPDYVSAPAIAAWLRANPIAGAELMAENAAYVFFRILEGDGPVGAEGVVLTPGRSLAVDRAHMPLGGPVWLSTTRPDPHGDGARVPLRRLMVAQDTGGAIIGGVRGDVFWGFGAEAEAIAGRMADRGRYWLLLPRSLADRYLAAAEASN